MGKIKFLQLTDAQRLSLEEGFRNGDTHCFRMHCRAVLLKETSLKPRYRITNGYVTYLTHGWNASRSSESRIYIRIPDVGTNLLWTVPTKRSCAKLSNKTGVRKQSPGRLAKCHREESERLDFQTFFIRISARYKRIRKRPRGVPTPQLYEYKTEKLQEFERLEIDERSIFSLPMKAMSVPKDMFLMAGSFVMRMSMSYPRRRRESISSE